MIKLSPKLYIALFSFLLFLSLSSPALAAMPDLAGSWTVSEIISNNAVLDPESTSVSLGLNDSTELMSLHLSPYGYGKLLFCGVVYPVELSAIGNGIYALTDSDSSFLLSLSTDGSPLLCTLQDSLSLRLTPSDAGELPFTESLPVVTALYEAEAVQALVASVRSSTLNLSLSFSDADTTAMSNFMLQGRYWFDGTFLYGLAFDKNDILPNLVRMEVSFPDAVPQPGTCEPLDRHVNAVFLTPVDNWLYYIRHNRVDKTVSLTRLNLNTLEPETLFSASELSFLHFHNNKLYFTAENHHFFSSDLTGNDLQPVLEKEVYYPYFLDDDRLLYQDSADAETFHLFRCSDGTDVQITNMPSFHPILSGSNLYFLSAGDNTLHLSCMDLSNPSPDSALPFPIETSPLPFSQEFSITHGKLCYNQHETDLAHWSAVSGTPDNESPHRILHIGASFLVSAEMDDYGGENVRALYLVDPLTGQEGVFRHVY